MMKFLYEGAKQVLSPEFLLSEIDEHKKEIIEIANLDEATFDILLSMLLERVKIIPLADYESSMGEAAKLIKDTDDIPFLALCISLNADGIWSDDRHFIAQNKMKIFRTSDTIIVEDITF